MFIYSIDFDLEGQEYIFGEDHSCFTWLIMFVHKSKSTLYSQQWRFWGVEGLDLGVKKLEKP